MSKKKKKTKAKMHSSPRLQAIIPEMNRKFRARLWVDSSGGIFTRPPVSRQFFTDGFTPCQQSCIELFPCLIAAAVDHAHHVEFQLRLPSDFGSLDPEAEVLGTAIRLGDVLVVGFDLAEWSF